MNFQSERARDWSKTHGIEPEQFFTLDDFSLTNTGRKTHRLKCFESVWHFKSEKANHLHVVPKSSPVVFADKVIFGSDRGILWALDSRTGAEHWRFKVSDPGRQGIWSRANIDESRVYFGSYDGNLYCLDADSGSEVWRNGDGDWIGSSPTLDPANDRLWIGLEHRRPDARGSIAAFTMSTGEKKWERFVPDLVHCTPAYSPSLNAVAIGANDHRLYLLDAMTGDVRWEFVTEGPIKDAPLFDEARHLIYCAGFDGVVRAIDTEPPRVCRRLIGLSYAAMDLSSSMA